jgi:hypothetical protein
MSAIPRRTHIVPTHLGTPETVLSIWSISLSARQFLLLLIGAALSYDLWLNTASIVVWPALLVLRFGLAILPFVGTLALAFVRIAGRELPIWVLVLNREESAFAA